MDNTDAKIIVETERLVLREVAEADASFVNELLNSEGFLKYIGDRGVRTDDEARVFIRDRYRKSYSDNGYGLYTVVQRSDGASVGVCGFVRRDTLPGPDIGFAFLPEHERKGFGLESASAMMDHGRDSLGFAEVYAITTVTNGPSMRLLEKLGFHFLEESADPDGTRLNVFLHKLN
jgi:RimJ/RimL family protein N-acetyltransferase